MMGRTQASLLSLATFYVVEQYYKKEEGELWDALFDGS